MTATDDAESLIRKAPDVIGGEACIRRSRIAVYMLVEYRQLGVSDAELLRYYPDLTQADLDAAWAYYAANTDVIDTAIRLDNEAE